MNLPDAGLSRYAQCRPIASALVCEIEPAYGNTISEYVSERTSIRLRTPKERGQRWPRSGEQRI
jgi:hypothetical protein